jgi:hypothetical protein
MADTTRRVSGRLSLDDAARVEAGLPEVGETGQRSFDQIKGGAERASRSLALLDVATRGIQIAGAADNAINLVLAAAGHTHRLLRAWLIRLLAYPLSLLAISATAPPLPSLRRALTPRSSWPTTECSRTQYRF